MRASWDSLRGMEGSHEARELVGPEERRGEDDAGAVGPAVLRDCALPGNAGAGGAGGFPDAHSAGRGMGYVWSCAVGALADCADAVADVVHGGLALGG